MFMETGKKKISPMPAAKRRMPSSARCAASSDSSIAAAPVMAFWIRYSRLILPMPMPISRISAISRRESYMFSSAMVVTRNRFITRITAQSMYTILRLRSTLSITSRSTVLGLMIRRSALSP